MGEQWFLDLDGIRSGPYPTSEVLGLIADGEVLPHHRIARGLKDPVWQTIVEWRLEQARSGLQGSNSGPKRGELPRAAPTPTPAPEAPVSPPPAPELSTAQSEFLKEVENLEKQVQEQNPSGTKRDPMAEMFDVLQSQKAKKMRDSRPSKESPLPNEAGNQAKPKEKSVKTAVFIGVCVIGFLAGQVYRNLQSPSSPTATAQAPVKTEPSPAKTEVVDRSTDKMTIRSVVEKKPSPSPTQYKLPPRAAPPPPALGHSDESPAVEKKPNDREMEELRDLKRELQELKALKEQLKDAPLNDDFIENDGLPDNSAGSFGGARPSPGIDPAPGGPSGSPSSGDGRF